MWGEAAGIIGRVLITVVELLIKAFVDGDEQSYKRVADIIPDPLKSEALLAHEQARLKALQDGQ